MTRTVTSRQLTSLTGITARQLQWWDESGLVIPQHHGHSRLYNQAEQEIVGMILLLRRSGFSLQRVRQLLDRAGRT